MEKTQENYNKVLKIIEENSVYRFSAGTTDFGAFLIPINIKTQQALSTPFFCNWDKLIKLSELFSKKPLSLKR